MAKKKTKKMRLTEEMRGKLRITYVVMICLFLLLVGRIVIWNINHGKEYSTTVLGQQTNSSLDIPYERGKIYDRNGNLLAGNEKLFTLILEPKNLYHSDSKKQNAFRKATAKALKTYFDIDENETMKLIKNNKDSYYIPLKSELSYQTVEKYEKFYERRNEKITEEMSEEDKSEIRAAKNIRGISFETSYKRIYPYNTLACHLIGFTSAGNVGNWGIEQYYNSTLNGTDGRSYSYFDEELIQEQTVKESINGNSVVSTIDLQIQQIIEKKLKEYDRVVGSKETSILVMDPNSGEVLAMANSDPYDLNDPVNEDNINLKFSKSEKKKILEYTKLLEEGKIKKKDVEESTTEQESTEVSDKPTDSTEKKDKKKEDKKEKDEKEETPLTKTEALSKVWRNPIISDTYEPGSTYKPFTVSAGLESGVLNGKEEYVCTGSLPVGKRHIGCSHVHGGIDLKNAVAKSCNVAMMNIAFKEGADTFYYYQDLFGFGKKTGIDLPGEADTKNVIYNAKNYSNSATIATNAFGQNFNCTMIEMASAFCSLINGGYYYKPHVVKEIQNNNGDIVESKEKEVLKRTISSETSKKIRGYLKETVETGTGTKAQIEGYSIGGKTGTAEKIPRNKTDYYISFMGFVPVESPELLIYVTIDEPHVDFQANAGLAVGLEQACMKEIVELLDIEPTEKVDSKKKEDSEEKPAYYLDPYTKKE